MSGDVAHPRNVGRLQGMQVQAEAFREAQARGRLHHAWLLCGPEGSGKASFAYQAARRLLGARPAPGAEDLSTLADDHVARMIAAQSHPDLLVLERETGEGPARKSIPVDEARRLPEFFSKSPAIAPFRVAIIDAADDLNVNAANAVLKTLEEPSGRGVVFLVSHAPGRLLATIRSRCRRLAFQPWERVALVNFVIARTGLDEADAERLADMAQGAPGRALALAASGVLELDRQLAALLARLPDAEPAELLALAEGFRGAEGAHRFALVLDRLASHLRRAAAESALNDGASGGREAWTLAWDRLNALPGQVEGLNLDRADAFWSVMADLKSIARTYPIAC